MQIIKVSNDRKVSPSRLVVGNQFENGIERIQFVLPENFLGKGYRYLILNKPSEDKSYPIPLDENNIFYVDSRLTYYLKGAWIANVVLVKDEIKEDNLNPDTLTFISDNITLVVKRNYINNKYLGELPLPENIKIVYDDLLKMYDAIKRDYENGNFNGQDGKTAFELAVENGFEGTEQEWLESLKGEPGKDGDPGEKGDPGDQGEIGLTPNIQIGTVTTLEPDQNATVERTGDNENPVFNFGIPRGKDGQGGGGTGEDIVTEQTIVEYNSDNVCNPETVESGVYENGVYKESETYYHTAFIPVSEGDVIRATLNKSLFNNYGVFKKNDETLVDIKSLVEVTEHTDVSSSKWRWFEFVVPAEVKSISLNFTISALNVSYMVTKNTQFPDEVYVAYEGETSRVAKVLNKDIELPSNSVKEEMLTDDVRNKLNKKELLGITWGAFGDSLTEGDSTYAKIVSDITGITLINLGDGGTGYKKEEDSGASFVQRVSSVTNDIQVLTVFGSFNDSAYINDNLGQLGDTTIDTLYGAMYKFYTDLFANHTDIVVGVITPCPWKILSPRQGSEKAEKYVKALIDTANYFSLPVLDLYHESGLRPWEEAFANKYYKEGFENAVHPTQEAHEKFIAPKVIEFIKRLIKV
jgi:hypothetical protein